MFQNICGCIHDNCIILTNSRTAIKNYHKYFFVYNGAKSSYDVKIHYETQNLFLKTFYALIEEASALNFDDESYSNQKNLTLMLKNNDKILPKQDEMIKIAFGLLVYNLCFSEAYEQSKIQNAKKESKFLKSQLLSFFYSKIQIFENLKNFASKYIKFLDNESLKDMVTVLKKFLEFGLTEIDQSIIELLNSISCQIVFTNENLEILMNMTLIIETIFLRYKQQYLAGNSNESYLVTTIRIQARNIKDLVDKGFYSLKNYKDLQEAMANEKFTLLANFVFALLELFKSEQNCNFWYQIITPILNEIFEKLNTVWNEQPVLKENIFYLYLFNFFENCQENAKTRPYYILEFFSLYGIFRNSPEVELEKSKVYGLFRNLLDSFNLLTDRKEFKDLLFLCRGIWQEQKNLEINVIASFMELCLFHIIKIKEEISTDPNNIDQMFIVEIMKFFLAIYLFLTEEKKINFFEPLIEFVFLFLNRSFPAQILTLANQILKHVLTTAKENVLRTTMERLPEELRVVVQGVIEIEKIGSQESKNKKIEEGNKGNTEQENLNKETQNQAAGQGKIKLKLFGAKKN